jgi:hypothetical protein
VRFRERFGFVEDVVDCDVATCLASVEGGAWLEMANARCLRALNGSALGSCGEQAADPDHQLTTLRTVPGGTTGQRLRADRRSARYLRDVLVQSGTLYPHFTRK